MKENKRTIVNGNGKNTKIFGYEFESLSSLQKYCERETCSNFVGREASKEGSKYFTETENWDEAVELLVHGWDKEAEKLSKSLSAVNMSKGYKNRNVYSVQGFQCSVPRYLQGMPDSMIANKRVVTKNKVVTITKSISYNGYVSTRQIEEESLKVLKLIQKLESEGQKVNLYICDTCAGDYSENRSREVHIARIKLKSASQRLNVKQMAFPLCHPSMLRRIMFRFTEVNSNMNKKKFTGYGYAYNNIKEIGKTFQTQGAKSYVIPNMVEEKEITDLSKYEV